MKDTKIRIAEATIDLLRESDLHEIQMSEIAELSLVSDRTIRRNFNGKKSIIMYYLEYMNRSLDFFDVKTVLDATMKYISLWRQERELIELLRKRELLYLLYMVNLEFSKKALYKNLDMVDSSLKDSSRKEYLINLIIHLEVSLFTSWIENDIDMPLDELKEKLKKIMLLFKDMEY